MLEAYPQLIADNESRVYLNERALLAKQREIDQKQLAIKGEVANDPDLTNKTKRKAAYEQRCMEDAGLVRLRRECADIEEDIGWGRIERSRLLREFDVAKLQYERETVTAARLSRLWTKAPFNGAFLLENRFAKT